jgi:hypothetical protein
MTTVSSIAIACELPANRPKRIDVAAHPANGAACKQVPGPCQDEGLSAVV